MIIQAELRRKQSEYEGEACVVDKVIELPAQRFRQFSRALLADYDFIAENKNAIRHDDARHCLLILDAEGKDGFLVDPQGHNYARYSAFVPNARSLLTPDMGIDRSYLSPAEPWRNENRDEMLRMTLHVEGKLDYILVLPADEEYLDAVKAYLDIDVFADAMLCDIQFKVPYIGELIRDTDCPAVEDYNDFAEALEGVWQQDGMLLTYAAVLEAEKPETLRGALELLQNTPHPEEDKRLGTVGHVRMDFGRSGNEFWHTWWPRGPEELNSPAFKLELQEVVDTLRESVLKNRFAMERFCYEHGGKISGGWTQNYGYIVETEHYRYCLRCNPSPGDYNAYLICFDLDVQRQNMAQEEAPRMDMGGMA